MRHAMLKCRIKLYHISSYVFKHDTFLCVHLFLSLNMQKLGVLPAAGLPLLFIDVPKFQKLQWWYIIFPSAVGCALLCLLVMPSFLFFQTSICVYIHAYIYRCLHTHVCTHMYRNPFQTKLDLS